MNGFLLLDKPAGQTSFACVARVRRILNVKRVGHTGTLDPQAQGLLILLVGSATKTQERFLALPKHYCLRAELGRQTTTGDLTGTVTVEKPFDGVSAKDFESTLSGFEGESEQCPPMYSALKYKGKPYYSYARKGIEIPRRKRMITVYSFKLLGFDAPYWEARVVCSRGTYVRTLVEDVAIRMGTVSTLVNLVRERIGEFSLEKALPWSAIEEGNRERLESAVHPVPEMELLHA